MKATDFARRLETWFREILVEQANVSGNTVKSYATTFTLLIRFFEEHKSIPVSRLSLDHLTADSIRQFLRTMEKERKSSISTRNQRLAAIRSFFKYIQSACPGRIAQSQQIRSLSRKRGDKIMTANHLTPDGIKTLLRQPSRGTPWGRRDGVLLLLLYDTGMRVQELVDLKPSNIRLKAPAQVSVFGKGRRKRIVPILPETVGLLGDYMREWDLDKPNHQDATLFFNHRGEPLSTNGVRYILRKYLQYSELALCDGKKRITPHTLRHSKAMHLLQSGSELPIIQFFLGHSELKTTMVYARTDIELTRAALSKAPAVSPGMRAPVWEKQPNLLKWLKQL